MQKNLIHPEHYILVYYEYHDQVNLEKSLTHRVQNLPDPNLLPEKLARKTGPENLAPKTWPRKPLKMETKMQMGTVNCGLDSRNRTV